MVNIQNVRLATLPELRENVLPNFFAPVPPLETLREWFRDIPKFKANPTAKRGGGTVWYSVSAVEKFISQRSIHPIQEPIRLTPSRSPLFIPGWLDDLGLNFVEFRVFCHIARCGKCSHPLGNMAQRMNCDPRTIRDALMSLVEMGIISETRRSGFSTQYRIVS